MHHPRPMPARPPANAGAPLPHARLLFDMPPTHLPRAAHAPTFTVPGTTACLPSAALPVLCRSHAHARTRHASHAHTPHRHSRAAERRHTMPASSAHHAPPRHSRAAERCHNTPATSAHHAAEALASPRPQADTVSNHRYAAKPTVLPVRSIQAPSLEQLKCRRKASANRRKRSRIKATG